MVTENQHTSSTHVWRLGLIVLLCLPLVACGEPTDTQPTPGSRDEIIPQFPSESIGLTVYGYNYTDLGMYSFEVNGQGGGNLAVSSPGGGGGKHTCCVSIYPDTPLPKKVKIKWTRGDGHDIWCEQEVLLHGPIPPNPNYFEVHFYQDGHIELAVTEASSRPRMTLERFSRNKRKQSGNINNDEKFSRCKHGY